MQAVDQLIHTKWLISGHNPSALSNHSIAISAGVIEDILPTQLAKEQYSANITVEYNDHIVMPGLINAHTHIGMGYFRGLGNDLALMEWLEKHMWPAETKWLDHEFVKDASLFAMAEMIRSGTTCFNDMYFFLKATAEAAEISGMRAFIGMTVLEFPTNWAKTPDDYLAKGLEFYQQYHNHPRITATFAPHAPYTISDQTFIKIQERASELDVKINLHLHETLDEINQSLATYKKRPIKRLHDLGFLSSQVLAIHCANLNEEDLDIFCATQPHVIHCPESNMKLASGICPIEKLRDLDINVALGTDSVASNNDLDMLSEMRQASFLSKVSTGNSLSYKANETIELATINSAKALGIDKQLGTLKKGKLADFIAINLDDIEMLPIYDPIAQVVYASNRNQVSDVWVGGKQLMKNRQLLTLDEQTLKEKARKWGEKIRG